jgi:hypothetical protein
LEPVGSWRLKALRLKLPPGAHVAFEARRERLGVLGAGRAEAALRRRRMVAGIEWIMVFVGKE